MVEFLSTKFCCPGCILSLVIKFGAVNHNLLSFSHIFLILSFLVFPQNGACLKNGLGSGVPADEFGTFNVLKLSSKGP